MGSRDMILLAGTASFISLTQPQDHATAYTTCETDLHALLYPNCSFPAHHHYFALVILKSHMSHFFGGDNRSFCSRRGRQELKIAKKK